MIKSPYNFVPLNEQQVIPFWTPYISHDIPFKHGHSGEIQLKATAKSPIFVRNGAKKGKDCASFSNFNNHYFLPGSSIKGMLRAVLEIMSFGKMENKVNDHRYSVRDFYNTYIYNIPQITKSVRCGWLWKDDEGDYRLNDCGVPGRISMKEIDPNMAKFFRTDGRFDGKKTEHKSAAFKYKMYGTRSLRKRFTERILSDPLRHMHNIEVNGPLEGTLVFTGQPSPRKEPVGQRASGKLYEFAFFDSKKEEVVDEKIIDNFFFAYYDHDQGNQSEDWKYWKSKLDNDEKLEKIPVFFRRNDDGTIRDMGLSFLYKIAYDHSIVEAIKLYQSEQGRDLSEAIFGYIGKEDETGKDSLKGRVHVGHAFTENAQVDETLRNVVLGSPKASYYPTYIRQVSAKLGGKKPVYQTLSSKKPRIAGWKRYPVHKNVTFKNSYKLESENVVSPAFTPLKAETEFNCVIRYHNLRLEELGALLSAITFHDTAGAFHSIGLAKPLGYGKLKIQASLNDRAYQTGENASINQALEAYEAYMNYALRASSPKWHQSEQLRELVTMAMEQDNRGSSKLEYLQMSTKPKDNEFKNVQKAGEALDIYSKLDNIQTAAVASKLSEADYQIWQTKFRAQEEGFKKMISEAQQLDTHKAQQRADFRAKFEAHRTALLNAMKTRREAIRDQQVAAERELLNAKKAEKAAQMGETSFESIDPTHKKAFDNLKKLIQKDTRERYPDKVTRTKIENRPEGVLETTVHEALCSLILAIVDSASKKETPKWQKDFEKNPMLKKIASWIGEINARTLLDGIKNK